MNKGLEAILPALAVIYYILCDVYGYVIVYFAFGLLRIIERKNVRVSREFNGMCDMYSCI